MKKSDSALNICIRVPRLSRKIFRWSKLLWKAPSPISHFSFSFLLVFLAVPRLIHPSVRKLFIYFGIEKSHTPIGSRNDGGSLFHGIKGVGFQFQFDRASQGRESRDRRQGWLCTSMHRGIWGLRLRASRKETRCWSLICLRRPV